MTPIILHTIRYPKPATVSDLEIPPTRPKVSDIIMCAQNQTATLVTDFHRAAHDTKIPFHSVSRRMLISIPKSATGRFQMVL